MGITFIRTQAGERFSLESSVSNLFVLQSSHPWLEYQLPSMLFNHFILLQNSINLGEYLKIQELIVESDCLNLYVPTAYPIPILGIFCPEITILIICRLGDQISCNLNVCEV